MEKTKVNVEIQEAIRKLTDVVEINLEDKLSEIGISSLKFIRLVVDIEKRCNMRFEDNDVDANLFLSVKELDEYVNIRKQN
jgi:acyl carrier protein